MLNNEEVWIGRRGAQRRLRFIRGERVAYSRTVRWFFRDDSTGETFKAYGKVGGRPAWNTKLTKVEDDE